MPKRFALSFLAILLLAVAVLATWPVSTRSRSIESPAAGHGRYRPLTRCTTTPDKRPSTTGIGRARCAGHKLGRIGDYVAKELSY